MVWNKDIVKGQEILWMVVIYQTEHCKFLTQLRLIGDAYGNLQISHAAIFALDDKVNLLVVHFPR